MALMKCPECSREISDKAAACPSCGHPMAVQTSGALISRAESQEVVTSKPSVLATIVNWGLTGAVVALAFTLNPSEEQHRAKIRRAIAENQPIASLFGAAHLAALEVKYHSYGFFSYTERGNKQTTLGLFGIVFIYSP